MKLAESSRSPTQQAQESLDSSTAPQDSAEDRPCAGSLAQAMHVVCLCMLGLGSFCSSGFVFTQRLLYQNTIEVKTDNL